MQAYIIPEYRIIPKQAFSCYRDEAHTLGKGSIATVFRGRWAEIDVAVKFIQMTLPSHLNQDLQIYCETDYLHLVHFYGVSLNIGRIAIITELLFCNLPDLMKEGPISAALKECIKKDVTKAVNYLHGRRYAHKQITSTKIFWDGKKVFKLGCYDLCKVRIEAAGSQSTKRWRPHGTLTAEYARKKEDESLFSHQKIDIYALGVLAWYLQKEEEPFAGLTESEVVRELSNPNGRRLEIDPTWPSDIKNPIIACLDESEKNRPTALQLLTAQKQKEIKQVYMAFMATNGGNQLFSQKGMRDVIPIIASFLYRL